MMLSNRIIIVFLFLISLKVLGQSGPQQKQVVVPKAATVKMSDVKEDWNPVLQNIEKPAPDARSEKQKLRHIKDSLRLKYPQKHLKSGSTKSRQFVSSPYMGKNFVGNTYNYGTPNDNDIAVSNGNKLISVMNSTVFKYDLTIDSARGVVSLDAFSASLSNPNDKFDPKVLYDPVDDKFILIFLNGFTDSTSSITVAFSQTNDPSGAWNLYALPGNPLNNHLWTDFPMMAVTNQELFITVNLLYPDSSWQTGFNETIIWQINKASGYNGQQLNSLLHNNIALNGRNVRNLCPAKGGIDVSGPDMYFLSDRNLDAQNDTVFLVHINDTIGAPNQTVTVNALLSDVSYFLPPSAKQPGSGIQLLETNDSRVLGAFIENDKIQFVHNCLDTATGNAAVYHGVINNVSSNPSVSGYIVKDTLLEYGYPNISYVGMGSTDNTSIISFDYTALTVFPGMGAVTSDGSGSYSDLTHIKTGLSNLSILSGDERWGDYSGSQRKYNENGVVWMNGLFTNVTHKNTTWIAQLSLNSFAGIKTEEKKQNGMVVYPNPTSEMMNVSFALEYSDFLRFELYDVNGKLVKLLMQEKVKAGKNDFSFSITPLNNGIYFFKISSNEKEIFSKKVVKGA